MSARCPVDGRQVHHRWQPWSPELELAATLILIVLLFGGGVLVGIRIQSASAVKVGAQIATERDHWRTAYETLHKDVDDVVKHFDATDGLLLENDRKILAELKELKGKQR